VFCLQLIEIVKRSLQSRNESDTVKSFKYAIVLTKDDKRTRAQGQDRNVMQRQINEFLAENVPIISTSSVQKVGRDEVWQLFQEEVWGIKE
jgi:GTP-binding protein EngB required for normal cell division